MIMRALQQTGVLTSLLDLLFPPRCPGCQRSGYLICPQCLAATPPLPSPFCQRCHSPLRPHGTCSRCVRDPLVLNSLRAVSSYENPLLACIHALKYAGNRRLAEPLGLLLAQALHRYQLFADMIIPVPLHSERAERRGYNHAALLAHVCARQSGIPVYDQLLVRHRATSAQVGLDMRERRRNVAGAFHCHADFLSLLPGRTVLLIDDVSTTGATLEACATALFSAGAGTVWGLVLAKHVS